MVLCQASQPSSSLANLDESGCWASGVPSEIPDEPVVAKGVGRRYTTPCMHACICARTHAHSPVHMHTCVHLHMVAGCAGFDGQVGVGATEGQHRPALGQRDRGPVACTVRCMRARMHLCVRTQHMPRTLTCAHTTHAKYYVVHCTLGTMSSRRRAGMWSRASVRSTL